MYSRFFFLIPPTLKVSAQILGVGVPLSGEIINYGMPRVVYHSSSTNDVQKKDDPTACLKIKIRIHRSH